MTTTTRAAREATRAAYLAVAPEPTAVDEQCPTCHVQAGATCQRKGKEVATHNARTTRAAREAGRRRAEADLAGKTGAFIRSALTMGEPVERITEWVAQQSKAAAVYLAAQGWTPVDRSNASPWRSPAQTDHAPLDALRAAIESAARP